VTAPRHVLHVITGLATGGAEAFLCRLIEAMDRDRFTHTVVSLMDEGTVGQAIRASGTPVATVDMSRGVPSPAALGRLVRLGRAVRPDLVQGWMYHGNLAALLCAPFLGRPTPVTWGIRQSLYRLRHERPLTRAVILASAPLSSLPARTVYNTRGSVRQHGRVGYDTRRAVVIPNGFDFDRFRPDPQARRAMRAELGLVPDTPLVGLVARVHPMKDHGTFLRAAARVAWGRPEVHFVLAGRDADPDNAALAAQVAEAGLRGRVHALGERRDIAAVTASLDIACSSSAYAEGFCNAVGEAMACGVPCVVTNVGDSAWLVRDTGQVMPPRDPTRMAAAIGALLDGGPEHRARLGAAARERIRTGFGMRATAARYERLYTEVTDRATPRPAAALEAEAAGERAARRTTPPGSLKGTPMAGRNPA